MDGIIRKILLSVVVAIFLTACASSTPEEDRGGAGSEFSDFDNSQGNSSQVSTNSEDAIESELNKVEEPVAKAESKPAETDDFAAFENDQKQQPVAEAPPEEMPPLALPVEPPPPPQEQATPPPVIAQEPESVPPPVVEEPAPVPAPMIEEPSQKVVNIKKLQYKANDSGGTLSVEADGPMTYTTRVNSKTKQFIVEIPNSKLSKKAQRSLNTKDFGGTIGSIDPYQNPGSDISRIVIQLREGASEPVVQTEGNALLIVTNEQAPALPPSEIAEVADSQDNESKNQSKILSSASLEEFLSGTQRFYGKKISIESNDSEVRDIIKFISDESGVNLVLSEDVKGKLSIKLKQIPWDQALVIVMKSKKLGYSRQGQVLRIAQLKDLREEEENFQKIIKAKQDSQPLTVKMIPVSYSKVEDLIAQVRPFMTDRGKIIPDVRTSAVVISDNSETIRRVERLIQSLDIPPAQVLIEGKIVEARDSFQRDIGIKWGTSGDSIDLGVSNSKGQAISTNLGSMNFNSNGLPKYGNFNFALGTLDFLGDLTASLSLGESQGKVKVLSSPRILTLHNEPAEINQTTQLPILTFPPVVPGAATTAAVPTVTFKDIVLKLLVTPQVTNDASVIMAVDVKRDFPGPEVDTVSKARTINNRSAKTKVIVKNGQTAVIGGIYQSDTSDSENGVPGLSQLPVVGWLFKSKSNQIEKNELLIFLTPRIVGHADSGLSTPAATNFPSDELDKESKTESNGDNLDEVIQ